MKILAFTFLLLAGCLLTACHLEKLSPADNSDADFTVDLTNNSGFAPCTVQFSNLSSNGIAFEWNFGDATALSSNANPSHLYTKPGDYLVTLTITDIDGNKVSLTKAVTIKTVTFAKLLETPDSYYVSDVVETRNGKFWVIGTDYGAGSNSAYVYIADWFGNKEDLLSNGSIEYGITAAEIFTDFVSFLGNSGNQPKQSGFEPPDLYITKGIGPVGTSMADGLQTSDGGYICIINTGTQIFVKKVLMYGDPHWEKYLGSGETSGRNVIATADGGYAIVGIRYVAALSQNYLYVTKLNGSGNVQWTYESYGTTELKWDIAQINDGNFMVCGGQKILKISSSGALLWEKSYPAEGYFFGIAPSTDNGVVVTGGNGNVVLLKVDQNGNKQWNRVYNSNQIYEEGRVIRPTSDCGFIVLAAVSGGWTDGPFLIKTDALGNVN